MKKWLLKGAHAVDLIGGSGPSSKGLLLPASVLGGVSLHAAIGRGEGALNSMPRTRREEKKKNHRGGMRFRSFNVRVLLFFSLLPPLMPGNTLTRLLWPLMCQKRRERAPLTDDGEMIRCR